VFTRKQDYSVFSAEQRKNEYLVMFASGRIWGVDSLTGLHIVG